MNRTTKKAVSVQLLAVSLLLVGCAGVIEKVPIAPPQSLPDYQAWTKICFEADGRRITMEQKLDPQFWKGNLDEPIPPQWFYNQVLGLHIPTNSPYDGAIMAAYAKNDYDTAARLKRQFIRDCGITDEQNDKVVKAWFDRNSYHNLSYYAIGVSDKKTCSYMSNPNPDDPASPFAKEGENIIVTEVMEDGVSDWMKLAEADIAKIGMFEKGLLPGGEDYIKEIVQRAQHARFLLGATRREGDWESYSGFKPGGVFGIASRKRQKI